MVLIVVDLAVQDIPLLLGIDDRLVLLPLLELEIVFRQFQLILQSDHTALILIHLLDLVLEKRVPQLEVALHRIQLFLHLQELHHVPVFDEIEFLLDAFSYTRFLFKFEPKPPDLAFEEADVPLGLIPLRGGMLFVVESGLHLFFQIRDC